MPITAPPTIPLITDPSTFAVRAQDWVVWQADELYPFISETSAILALSTTTISVTSNTIGTGLKSFTVQTGKGFVAGQSLSIAYTTTPTNRMFAVVNSYNSGTGALSVNVQGFEGSGTYTSWSIALAFNGVIGYTQLGSDILTTQPQFDNDTSLATTGFVQRALGGYSAITGYDTTAQTIPAAQANRVIYLFGSASTITLPLANTVPVGSVVRFLASTACTISRQGADTILASSTSSALTSVAISDGGELIFVSDGTSRWLVTGTDALTYSTGFYNTLLAKFNATGAAPVYACRAWVSFNGTGTVAIQGSGNISSITDNGVGLYTLNFTTSMPDTVYCVVGSAAQSGGSSGDVGFAPAITKNTGTCQVRTSNGNGLSLDYSLVNFAIFR